MMMKLMASVFRLVASLLQLAPLQQRVVLMSRQSDKPSLDFRLLALQLEREHPDVEVSMCLSQPELSSKAAFVAGTLKQLKEASHTQVVVVDGYVPAVCIPKKRSGAKVLQMWHALGAVKKFGFQSVDTASGRSSQDAKAAHMHENYDAIVAGGYGSVGFFAAAFGYSEDAVVPLGLPRIDYLVDQNPQGARAEKMSAIREANPVFKNGKKTILYAPTLRKGEGYEGWLGKAVESLAQSCDGNVFNFVVTAHPLNNDIDEAILECNPHVTLVRGASTIDLLGLADCVITDYSAVALEAGILGKPVYFFVPDIDVYRTSPGLNIDPLEHYPQVSSADAATLMKAISNAASEPGGIAPDPDFSAMIEHGFGPVMDGRCCERIAAQIMQMLDRS